MTDFKLFPAKSIFLDSDFFRFAFEVPGFRVNSKAGDLLFAVHPEMYKDVNFTFSIVFSDPKVIEGHPVLISLQRLLNTVDHLILSFRSLLA